jgi:hypothetical protein
MRREKRPLCRCFLIWSDGCDALLVCDVDSCQQRLRKSDLTRNVRPAFWTFNMTSQYRLSWMRTKARLTTTPQSLGYGRLHNENTATRIGLHEQSRASFIVHSLYIMNSHSPANSSEHHPTNGAHSENSNGYHAPIVERSPTTPIVVASDRVQYTDDAILARYTYEYKKKSFDSSIP